MGAGKTTLLNHVLANRQGLRVAVIVNDMSEVNIDAQLVDGANFFTDLKIGHDLKSLGQAAAPDDTRTVADLLIDQVEFANVIVLNKMDLVSEAEANEIEAFIEQLNPYALKLRSEFGHVPLDKVLGTQRYDFEVAKQSRGWQLALRGEGASETEEYGVTSFVYRARRPFHPQRFYERLSQEWPGVLQSKGFFWLASRLDKIGVWSQAGRIARLDVGGFWWAAVPREDWPQLPGFEDSLQRVWQAEVGDCRQELVFIGIGMDQLALYDSLQACLLTDEEVARGPASWPELTDPFPAWNVQYRSREVDG